MKRWPSKRWVATSGTRGGTFKYLADAKNFVERQEGYCNSVIVQVGTGRTYTGTGEWRRQRRSGRPRKQWHVRWGVLNDMEWTRVMFAGLVHVGKFFDRVHYPSFPAPRQVPGRLRCRPKGDHVLLDRTLVRSPSTPLTCLLCVAKED